MSKCVSFQNPGVIDARAYRLFGASAKTGSNPIGFFGTGLKYAIAIFLRLGCKVELWHGLEKVTFSTTAIDMRGSQFQVVTATPGECEAGCECEQCGAHGSPASEELGFTTELGKTWKPWQALRELWCNALDEGGEMQAIRLEPKEGHTTIVVTGQQAMDAWHERDKILLQGAPARVHSEGVAIHEKRGRAVYFRGVRVMDLPQASVLTYNIEGHTVELTEDRTAKYEWLVRANISQAIANCDDERVIQAFLEAPQLSFEASLDLSDQEPSAKFMEVLESNVRFRAGYNASVLKMYQRKRGKDLRPAPLDPLPQERQMLEKAKDVCRAVGLDVERYPIHVTVEMEQHVLGMACLEEGAVYLHRRAFMQGTKMVAGTLMEELIHLQHKLTDESRSMQNFLVDLVMHVYEQKVGAPL